MFLPGLLPEPPGDKFGEILSDVSFFILSGENKVPYETIIFKVKD